MPEQNRASMKSMVQTICMHADKLAKFDILQHLICMVAATLLER